MIPDHQTRPHCTQQSSTRAATSGAAPIVFTTRLCCLSALLSIGIALAACSSDDTTRSGLFEPYRTDLPQGNYVTQEMLDQVSEGMNDQQVARTLGSPLLRDVFQPRQWNYVFSYRHPNGRVDLRRVKILFDENNQVATIQADELPQNESPADPALPGFRKDAY